MNAQKLPYQSDWTWELIDTYYEEIERVARHYKLETYRNQLEIITSDQMLDAYSSTGMPVIYSHWSFAKHFAKDRAGYRAGRQGLAYELVINSDPSIAYLMENNTMMMQALVIAHASFGHNSFFMGNRLFRDNTDAAGIIDYLDYARNFISLMEERLSDDREEGWKKVERVLDACHSLQYLGVDRYKHPPKLSLAKEAARQQELLAIMEQLRNPVFDKTVPQHDVQRDHTAEDRRAGILDDPQENILYFIEKNSPRYQYRENLWEKEIVRIVRKIAQYFYPQRQTQLMNEGWATFWHYTIINHLYEEGKLHDGFMMEFLKNHTAVVAQPPYHAKWYSGINVYALGFAMWQDIKRVAMEPTDEDRKWFRNADWVGCGDWLSTFDFAMRNFKDESFVLQYLSPKIMRDFSLFSVYTTAGDEYYTVSAIHDQIGYEHVREVLSAQYNLANIDPDIQVVQADLRGTRALTLRYKFTNNTDLYPKEMVATMSHLHRLWGHDVFLDAESAETGVSMQIATTKRVRK